MHPACSKSSPSEGSSDIKHPPWPNTSTLSCSSQFRFCSLMLFLCRFHCVLRLLHMPISHLLFFLLNAIPSTHLSAIRLSSTGLSCPFPEARAWGKRHPGQGADPIENTRLQTRVTGWQLRGVSQWQDLSPIKPNSCMGPLRFGAPPVGYKHVPY